MNELSSPDRRLTAIVTEPVERAPLWEPGRIGGEPVAVQLTLPVKFELPEAVRERVADGVYEKLEVVPQFKGGGIERFQEWVFSNIDYPENAKLLGITGKVVLRFVVGTDGSVEDISVLLSPDNMLSAAAVSVLRRSPKWTPGMSDGKPVRVSFFIPIIFMVS